MSPYIFLRCQFYFNTRTGLKEKVLKEEYPLEPILMYPKLTRPGLAKTKSNLVFSEICVK